MRALLTAVLLASAGLAGRLEAAAPWDVPFAGSPAAILAAASAARAEAGEGAVVLLEEGTFTFDAKGRVVYRLRYVVRVLTPAAVESWSTLETSWAPWHEAKPRLRARVVTADGTAHELDQKTITDAPAADDDPSLFSDRRVVRAPLPALAPGSVVEEEITVEDVEPSFTAGTVHRFVFGGGEGTERTRLVVSSPASLPVRTWVSPRLAPLTPARTEAEGRVTLVFESGRLAPVDDVEPGAPGDLAQGRYVLFSTGESWNAVARRYAEIVDGQLGASARVAAHAPGDRAGTIDRILAAIQKEIRYTGIELSEASLVPRPPAETVRRRFGDCKDKAALLVARLREAGIPASVALLDAGPGLDVRPELPGLAFDHAVVHVPGPPDLWIDPTDELARAGELPVSDQGRLALVADAGTQGLVRLPESTSATNRRILVRDFRLGDDGPARVSETREATGSRERQERARFSGGDRKRLQEAIERYAKETYLSKGAVRWEAGDPRDLTRPFRVRVEADQAGRGVTDETEALVAVFPASLVDELPAALLPEEEEEGEEGAPAPKRRVHDFVFLEPFTEGWVYRVHPPPGYSVGTLPESTETPVGTGRLVESYRAEPDGSISATVTFDSGKRRLLPAEFDAYRAAVAAVSKRPAVFLRFVQTGMAHLAAGRVREALVELRKLSAERPGQAVHRSQVALALLQGGLGEAARREARRAVELEPGSARAHRTLGWVLEHDLIGRRFAKGFDRPGALAAFRKAKELDPKDAAGRAELAILLEHDERGTRYGPSASLAEAVTEYRAIQKDLGEHRFDVNLFVCLYRSRRFDELADAVRAVERSETGDECLVLCAAAQRGVEAARREALRLMPEPGRRREALERVAQTLAQLRLYPEAAALLSDAASGSPKAASLRARSDVLGRARPWDAAPLPEGDPRSLARRFYVAVTRGDADAFVSLFTKAAQKELASKEAREELGLAGRTARASRETEGVPQETLLDLALSVLQITVEGSDDEGYRLRLRTAAAGSAADQTLYAVREDAALRLLASDGSPSVLGEEALRRAEAGNAGAARLWLDWARDEVWAGSGDDPLSGSPFARLWTRGVAADLPRVLLAARVLAAAGARPGPHLPALEKARAAAEGPEEERAIDRALAGASLAEKRWGDLLALVGRLEPSAPESETAFRLRQLALTRLGRAAEARESAEARLARRPDDPVAVRALSQLAFRARDLARGEALLFRLVERGTATAADYNELAWAALFTPPVRDGAVEDAQRAVELTRSSRYAVLHTLAALYAETGRTSEARDLILKALDLSGREEPASEDWYVLGRLAEQYGETAAAAEAYRRVEPPAEDEPEALSTFTLAQTRLAPVGPAAGAKKPAAAKAAKAAR